MIANSLHNGSDSRVSHTESFARLTTQQDFTGGGTVTDDVSSNDLVTWLKRRFERWSDDHPTAGEPLTDIIVGVTDEPHRHAPWHEGAETLSSSTGEGEVDGVIRKTLALGGNRHTATQHSSHGAVDIANADLLTDGGAISQSLSTHVDELHIETCLEVMILIANVTQRGAVGKVHLMQNRRQVKTPSLPVRDGLAGIQCLNMANSLVNGAESELSENFASLLSHHHHEVDDVVGITGEFLTQFRILSSHTYRAGVGMALTHYDASLDNERGSCEPKLFGAKQGSYDDVASGLELTVTLHHDAVTKTIKQQGLLSLGQA